MSDWVAGEDSSYQMQREGHTFTIRPMQPIRVGSAPATELLDTVTIYEAPSEMVLLHGETVIRKGSDIVALMKYAGDVLNRLASND